MQAARGPDFERYAVARAGHNAEQPQLPFAAADELAQRRTACGFATALVDRQAQLRAGPAQSDAPMLHRDERDLAFAAQVAADCLCFDCIQGREGALQGIITGRPECKPRFECTREMTASRLAESPSAHTHLVQRRSRVPPPQRNRLDDQIANRDEHERCAVRPPRALDAALDPWDESRWID